MIYSIFPTNILIKDLDLNDEEIFSLKVAVQSICASHEGNTGVRNKYGVNADTLPVFTKENIEVFPILKKIRDCFVDAYVELAESNEDNPYTRELIETMIADNHGQLPVMRKGDELSLHTHPGAAAYGILYLTTLDNEVDGGQLILRDPSFHTNPGFRRPMIYPVNTKAGRLVIAPAYIWHEVTRYFGEEERYTIVCNLSFISEKLLNCGYKPEEE